MASTGFIARKQNISKRTIILLSQTLASLPDDVMMTMKLLYYDEVTPPDYEPPGFKHTPNDLFNFVEEPLNIKVGDVSTPFHTVKLRIKTDCQQFEMKDDSNDNNNEEANNIELAPVPSKENNTQDSATEQQDEADYHSVSPSSPCDIEKEKGQMCEEKRKENEKGVEDMDCDKELPDKTEENPGEDIKVKCPCENDEDEGLMILCGVCDNWQHAVCFGVLKQEEAPEFHVCVDCSKGERSGQCTDSSLGNLNTIALQATCLWRRTLLACSELNRILPTTLARHLKIEMSIAQGLVKRLEKEGFIRSTLKGKRLGKVVNKKKVQAEGFGKYFYKGNGKLGANEERSEVVVQDRNKSVDGVETIIQQCSKMDVSGALETFKKKMCNEQGKLKRAISLKDETAEFDISDSQEQTFEDHPLSKRRKASIAKSAILV